MNFDEVSLLPWVQAFSEKIKNQVQKSVLEWCKIVLVIGLDETDISKWTSTYEDQIEAFLEDLNKDALDNQNKLIENIEKLLKHSEMLCKELQLKMPSYGSQKLSLINEQKMLSREVEKYQKMIDNRHKELEVLEKRMKQVCISLGRQPKCIPYSPLPSDEQITQYKNDIASYEKEEYDRWEKFTEIKSEIVTLCNKIKYKPKQEFEKKILLDEDASFKVSDINMAKVKEFHERIKQFSEEIKDEIDLLYDQVKQLWKILEEDEEMCAEFMKKYSGYSVEDLDALKLEISRCQELKKTNLEVFVKKLRQELLYYWDVCMVSEKERDQFVHFDDNLYSEDLVSLFDLEVQKWKNYYTENNAIFKLLTKRNQLWKRLEELEHSAVAPNRYKNRGGLLLKEEKERNALNKLIPKLEEQLREMSQEYVQKNGKAFTVYGEDLDLILEKDKENEKKLKSTSTRKNPEKSTMVVGRSGMPLTPANLFNLARNTTCKKRLITPSMSSSKMKKGMKEGLKTAPPKFGCAKVIGGRSRYSTDKKKKLGKSFKEIKLTLDYDKFKEELSGNEKCRSTEVFGFNMSPLAIPLSQTPNRMRI